MFQNQNKSFITAILGPDGSGKSTLLDSLSLRCSSLGRRNRLFHYIPPIKSGKIGSPCTNPHGKASRGCFMSVVKLGWLVMRYNLGWLVSISLPCQQCAMVYFDRYYHDMIADPKRYRLGAPAWLVTLFGKLVPKPDIFLILDVAPEVARARKTEVSEDESQRQFHAYRALADELPNAVLIDANAAPEDVVAQAEKAIVEAMERRLSLS